MLSQLPNYLFEYICSFLDFDTVVNLISVPSVYRYLLTLALFVKNMGQPVKSCILATVEPYYHLNRYNGLTIFDIYRFITGVRILGNNITYGQTRELWVHNFEWHRSYGPAVIYRCTAATFPMREAWYFNGNKHRRKGPSIIIYFENGRPRYEGWTRHDYPYRSNSLPTGIEYSKDGEIITEIWQNEDGSIKMIKRLV